MTLMQELILGPVNQPCLDRFDLHVSSVKHTCSEVKTVHECVFMINVPFEAVSDLASMWEMETADGKS